MRLLAKKIVLCAGLALGAGCSAKPLQADAGGRDGSGTIGGAGGSVGGAGGAIGGAGGSGGGVGGAIGGAGGTEGDDGGATDAAGDALFSGRRSFVVTSTLTVPGGAPTGGPTSHVFTMVVDADNRTAILGAYGNASVSPIEPVAGGFRVTMPPAFAAAAGSPWKVSYTGLTFVLDPAGALSSNSSGQLFEFVSGCNMVFTGAATMSLTGLPDTVGPVFTLAASADLTDPFTSFSIISSEPLPGTTATLVLRAAGGDAVVLAPSTGTPDTFVPVFTKPSIVLRYGEQYRIDPSGASDFAGNVAVSDAADGLVFTTMPAPPLVAADGFESVNATTLGGAQVLSDAADPIIDGTRSLYVPPGATNQTTETQLALRLAAGPGTTVLRFAYRIVNPDAIVNPGVSVGSVGGSIGGASLPASSSGTTAATIGGTQVMLGPVANAVIALPAGTTDEIVLERVAPPQFCQGFPPSPTTGIIIDDLRVE